MSVVSVIGVGNMGLGVALRLVELGHAVTVRDLRPEREAMCAGCAVASSAAAAAAQCVLLIIAVVDAAQTEAVLFGPDGAAAAMAGGACVMLSPTIAPADVERFAARLAEPGIGCIDAPMSGGPARARDGTMSLMVACADDVFERHAALLQGLASRLHRVGTRPGDGARTKLVNNLLATVNLAGAAEAVALAEALGLDARRTLAVIEQSSGQSWIGSDRMARALDGDFAPRAHTTLLAKDGKLALAMAAQAGVFPALGTAAAALFDAALAAGYGPEDDARLLTLLRAQRAAAAPPGPAGSAP